MTEVTNGRARYAREASEFDRALAFFDASFAFAMTLLVTTLEVGDAPSSFASVSALANGVGAQFIAFLISFAVIAGYWLMNHRMFAGFAAIDTQTIVANICLLAGVVLLPFSTAAVGDPAVAELPLPTVLMAVNVALVSGLHTLVWVIANRNRLLDRAASATEWRQRVVTGLVPAAVFLASVPLAYAISPDAARLFWASLLVLNPAVGTLMARTRQVDEA
jgi:uncharacterized membrane protein